MTVIPRTQLPDHVQCVDEGVVDRWALRGNGADDHTPPPNRSNSSSPVCSLFAFPAEENFSGQ